MARNLIGVLQGDTKECFRRSVATVLQVSPDDLPRTNLSNPDWVARFSRELRSRYGVRLELLPPQRLPPTEGRWIAIIDPMLDPDSRTTHALVCKGHRVAFDPAGRYGQRPVSAHRVLAGVRLHEPGADVPHL